MARLLRREPRRACRKDRSVARDDLAHRTVFPYAARGCLEGPIGIYWASHGCSDPARTLPRGTAELFAEIPAAQTTAKGELEDQMFEGSRPMDFADLDRRWQ